MSIALPSYEQDITADAVDRQQQHWVPKAYLQQWRDPNSPQGAYILVSPKDRSVQPKFRSAKRTFTLSNMNTMTKNGVRNLRLESIYHAMETSFGAVRAKIFAGQPPVEKDLEAIVCFVAAQMVRTPKFRRYWRPVPLEDQKEQLLKIADLSIRAALETTSRNINSNHQQILSLMAFPKALELLSAMRARLFKSPNPRAFVTSDAPCCVIDYKDVAISPLESLLNPTVNVLMPLGPDVVVLFDKSEEPHEMTLIFEGHPFIDRVNAMIWAGSVSEVVLPGCDIRDEWFNLATSRSNAEYSVM